jgi:predicted unusual protein kinase regulating ubiquinone biosynthesis (AarF/ABC1/UbiB family)
MESSEAREEPRGVFADRQFCLSARVGLSERKPARLYIACVVMDAEGIVDQLVRMGAGGGDVDRSGLVYDSNHLLNKYYGVPLKDIRA